MGCTKDSACCDWNPSIGEVMPPCCHKHLLEVIDYMTTLFKQEGIVHWADHGTLLGAIRDNAVIPWDSDADFGILSYDLPKLLALEDRINSDGFHFAIYEDDNLYQIQYSGTNAMYSDIWINNITTPDMHLPINVTGTLPKNYPPIRREIISTEEEICQCHGPGCQDDHTSDFPFWFVQNMTCADLDGLSVCVPSHPKKFLDMRYRNWQSPQNKGDAYWGGNAVPLHDMLDYVRKIRSKM